MISRSIKCITVMFSILTVSNLGAESSSWNEVVKRLLTDMKPVPGRTFLIERTEVTVGVWKAVVKQEVTSAADNEMPVSGVSWDNCSKS